MSSDSSTYPPIATDDAHTSKADVNVGLTTTSAAVSKTDADPGQPATMAGMPKEDLVPEAAPQMATIQTLWSRPIRSLIVALLVVVVVGYTVWGTILARNVTFNQSQNIDPGASNGIRRFSRETILDVWRTMWAKAPDFGTIDLTRSILLISTVAFFVAFATIITLVFVPSRREWVVGLGDDQVSDTLSGD